MLNHHPTYDAVSPRAGIHMSCNQDTEIGVALVIINNGDPLAKLLFPILVTLGSTHLEVLVPNKRLLPSGGRKK